VLASPLCAAVVVPGPATASPAIDGALRRLARDEPQRPTVATVRLPDDGQARAAVRATLSAQRVRPREGARGPIRVGRFEVVEGTARDLAEAARAGADIFVEPSAEPLELGPADPAGIAAAGAHGPLPLQGPRGRGIRIAALDNGADIYHPHFFAADAGAYPWVDMDGDGVLTPGIDAIDTDVDGVIADDEILRLLDYGARLVESQVEIVYEAPDGALQTDVDYVFVDFDGDGVRSYGPQYPEATPGWGEPLFVPDDADGDGTITIDERVLLLGTSKIAAVSDGERSLHRGVDLATWGRSASTTESHGTGVLGILVGGQDLLFRRHRGQIPDADVLLFARSAGTYTEAVAWARDEGARILLHEYGTYFLELDGSSFFDELVDAATAEGLINVCGAGNAGAAKKHWLSQAGASPYVATIEVPPAYFDLTVRWLWIHTHWRDPAVNLACSLVPPEGDAVPLVPDTTAVLPQGEVEVALDNTTGGTRWLTAQLDGFDGVNLGGTWQLRCDHDAAPQTEVMTVLRDLGTWVEISTIDGASPVSTIAPPGTADTCITVGATHFFEFARAPGELADYSGHGPRFGGGRTVDLVAPADPMVPYPSTDSREVGLDPPLQQNNYRRFGGSSGAMPFVGAAIAALLEVEPDLTPAQVRERLRERAVVDDAVGDEDAWGRGRLDARALVFDVPAEAPPAFLDVTLAASFEASGNGCVATVSVDPNDGEAVTARWDDDYDGVWDSDFLPTATRQIDVSSASPEIAVRVEVGRAGWRVGGAALAAVAPASCFEDPDDGEDDTTGTSNGTDIADDDGEPGDTSTGETTVAADGRDERGCSCRAAGNSGRATAIAGLGLVAWARRRRRRA
jgi:hypothetical protein